MSDGESPKLVARPFLYEVVEWSEQLRSVVSAWLGAAAVGFESDSAPAGEERENVWYYYYYFFF